MRFMTGIGIVVLLMTALDRQLAESDRSQQQASPGSE
jgi:hypothetical protein